MQVTILALKGETEKSFKYTSSIGTVNAAKSKIPKLEFGKTYELEISESEYQGKTMKWANKIIGSGQTAPSSASPQVVQQAATKTPNTPNDVMTKEDWAHKDAMVRRTTVMSYAKDILVAQLTAGKLLTVSDMLSWYKEMLEVIEKP